MIYLFDHQEKLIKIINSNGIKSFWQTQELTSDRYVSDMVEIEIKALPDSFLKKVEYIAVPDHLNPLKNNLYFVVKESTKGGITELIGVQSGIEELRKTPVFDQRPEKRPIRYIAQNLLKDTNWELGYVADKTISFINFYYIDVFEALKKLCEVSNVEMQFSVEINGNRIGQRILEIKERIGKNEGRRVVYGHNALEIVKEVEKTELYTALIGRGRGEQVSKAEDNQNEKDGYGRKITFEEIEWKKSKGKPLDKPLGQIYLEDKAMTEIYGIETPEGKRPKFGFVEFDTDDKEDLLNRTYEALKESNRPKLELKTSSIYLKDTGIGDTVRVIRHDRQLEYQTRVFQVKINRLSNHYSIQLGDQLSTESTGRSVSRIQNKITDLETQINQNLNQMLTTLPSADGFNQLYFSSEEPKNPRIGGTWYQPDPEHEGHFIMKTWDGRIWHEVIRTYDNLKFEKLMEDVEAKSQEMSSRIAEADEKVKQALESVKVNQNLAEEAQRLSEMTRNEFTNSQIELGAHYKRFKTLNDTTDKLKTDISGIQTDLDGLSSTVNKTMLDPKTGLLTRLQNEQRQTADALKSKLSSTEVSRLIDWKNLLSISQYTNDKTETARGIEQKLSELSSKIPAEIGGRNYVRGSADMSLGSGRWDTGTFRQSGAGLTATVSIEDFPNQDIKKAVRITRNNTGSPGITQDHFALSVGDWTLSWWLKAPIGTQFRIQAYWSDANNRTGVAQTMTSQTNDWQRVQFTTTNEVDGSSSIAYIYLVSGSEMLVTAPKLEKGRVLTDWSPAPEDNQIDKEAFSNLRRTASLTEQIFGSRDKSGALTNLSREIATSEIFQREVIKMNDRSNNLVVDGKGMEGVKEVNIRNGVTKYEDTIQPNGFRTIGIEATGQTAYRWAGISLPLSVDEVKKDEVYTFYSEYNIEALPDFDFVAQLKNQTTGEIAGSVNLERGAIGRYNQSFKIHVHRNVQNPELYLYLVKNGKVRISQPVLLKGSYDDVDSYVSSGVGSALSTRLAQMSDSWSMKVLNGKEDILSQLNLNSGGVKIQGNLIHLSGQTLIDDGVIKSAYIGKAQIDTAHIREIDASRARVINIDANHITANKTNFVQSAWNGINQHTFVGSDGIRVNHSDGSYTLLGSKGLETYIGGTGYRTHYLTNTWMLTKIKHSQHQQTAEKYKSDGMTWGHFWYQLPKIYVGKKFSAICALADVEFYDGAEWLLQRVVAYVDQDRLKEGGWAWQVGRVPIVAYAIYANSRTGKTKAYPVSVSLTVTL